MKVEFLLDGGIDWSAWIQAVATTTALAIAIWQMLEAERRNAQQRYATSQAAYSLAKSSANALMSMASELRSAPASQQSATAQRLLTEGHLAATIQGLTSFDAGRLPTNMLVSRFLLTAEYTAEFQTALRQMASGRVPDLHRDYIEVCSLAGLAASQMVQPLMEQLPGYVWRERRARLKACFKRKSAAVK